MGQILSNRDAGRTEAAVVAFEQDADRAPRIRGRRQQRNRSNIRAILLENLESEGLADAAVTELTPTTEIQRVYLEGEPTGGTFTLSFRDRTTSPIPWNATADELQAALEALETIGKGNVRVTLGKTTEFQPSEWLVVFTGTITGLGPLAQADLEAQGEELTDEEADTVPLMLIPDDNLTGVAVTVLAESVWLDSGRIEQVRSAIPVGTPTPQRAGAVVLCIPIPGAGYCVVAVEPRDFNPYEL